MAPRWRQEQKLPPPIAKSSASSIVFEPAEHSSVFQSNVPPPEASNTGAISPSNTQTSKNRNSRYWFANLLLRLWKKLKSMARRLRKTKIDIDSPTALDSNATPGQGQQSQDTVVDGSKPLPTTALKPSNGALEPRDAESNVPDSGPVQLTRSSSSYSFSAPRKQQNEQLGTPSETGRIFPSQPDLQPDVDEQIRSQEGINPVRPGLYAIGTNDSRGQFLQTAPEGSQNVSSIDQLSKFKTQFKMVIHASHDRLGTRIAKLDTGSKFNVVSQDVVNELRMSMEPYSGLEVNPIGDPIMPIGTVRLEWHIMRREKTYSTEFLVFRADQAKSFDMLLSEDEIARIGFYKVNDEVWFLDTADE